MDVIGCIFLALSIIAFAVVIGFAITWLVGVVKKSKGTFSVGKTGTIISGSITLAFLLIGIGFLGIFAYQQNKKEQEFIAVSEKFQKEYDATIFSLDNKNNAVDEAWSYYLFSDDDSTPVDATDVADGFSTSEMDNHFDKLDSYIEELKQNDTGELKLSYHYYQRAYNKLDGYRNLTYHPVAKGYLGFVEKSNDYSNSAENYSKKIKRFNDGKL